MDKNKFAGNPFNWEFQEQRMTETLAEQTNATYNEPSEGDEKMNPIKSFFSQKFAESSTPAFITGCTALDPLPYTI